MIVGGREMPSLCEHALDYLFVHTSPVSSLISVAAIEVEIKNNLKMYNLSKRWMKLFEKQKVCYEHHAIANSQTVWWSVTIGRQLAM